MRVCPGSPEHDFDHLGGLLFSADAEEDARSHRPLTSTVKLSTESSVVTSCLRATNNSGQEKKKKKNPHSLDHFRWVAHGRCPILFSDPDPEVSTARHPAPVGAKPTSEAPAGPGPPATSKVPEERAAEPGDLGKSSVSALPNIHHPLVYNS